MTLGPFLRRELVTLVRRGRAFSNRRHVVLLMAVIVAGMILLWDWRGWDRASLSGTRRFGEVTFTLLFTALTGLAIGILGPQAAVLIAGERDQKTLDALLTTRFSSAEIVLGAMAAGLTRFFNATAATIPIMLVVLVFGAVDPRLLFLGLGGLGATALFISATSIWVSVHARTGTRASTLAAGYLIFWCGFPFFFLVTLKPLLWPSCPAWIHQTALWCLDSSPMGLLTNVLGVLPRPGTFVSTVQLMIAWQGLGTLLLTAHAIIRLRPASRALYDVEGRTSHLRMLRQAMRRPVPRPACGDDPVLWNDRYSVLPSSRIMRTIRRAESLALLLIIIVMTSWFALPAFHELRERGYGPSPEAFQFPEWNPLPRVLVSKIIISSPIAAVPGQARLDFNVTLRQISALFGVFYVICTLANTTQSLEREQRRDTWFGLVATPLTGWEILRAKMIASLERSGKGGLILVGLWTTGLLSGAIHPIGYIAALAWLSVLSVVFGSLGLNLQLKEISRKITGSRSLEPLVLLKSVGLLLLFSVVPLSYGWVSLFSYEDVYAMIHADPFPLFSPIPHNARFGARSVALVWILGMIPLVIWAFVLTNSMCRRFDFYIGRPTRPKS